MKEHLIQVKTMSDRAIQSFMRCPCEFYHNEFAKRKSSLNWKQVVQAAVNQVVKHYYETPVNQRTSLTVLKLIDRNWDKIEVSLFHSKAHYYEILAVVSDHLLQSLGKHSSAEQPLMLQEKHHVYLNELDAHLALHFEVAEWSENSFRVRKFLVDENVGFVQLFKQMVIVFSQNAFNRLPECIEVDSLLNGNSYTFYPQACDYDKALEDIKMIKGAFANFHSYKPGMQGEHCTYCPVQEDCQAAPQAEERPVFYM
ncbi:hypothetical protein LC040_11590 [Bacillus tianshenii]|nr:hypothetical protein LC040_11590 [Bacillus tianshenii]